MCGAEASGTSAMAAEMTKQQAARNRQESAFRGFLMDLSFYGVILITRFKHACFTRLDITSIS
jgi:hypothetical protein